MKVMTYNIAHKTFKDIFFVWRNRYKRVIDYIKREDPDILGMQEITKKGVKYLKKNLNDYNIVGESRHSVIFTDEYTPVAIKKDYELISYKTYSLSRDINTLGLKEKEDNFPRICVVCHVKKDKNKYLIINTHIDNSDGPNKKRLVGIFKDIIDKEKNKDELLIIMGDFNMTLNNDDLVLFAKDYKDPFKEYTYGSFCPNPKGKSLDHIFLDKKLSYKEDKIDTSSNDLYPLSDHYPMMCEIICK